MEQSGKKSGDILEVRGLPGNSVDRDRHVGFREVMEAAPNKFNITEVVGNWDTGTSQKVTADALAVHGHFDGVFTQGGSDGTVQAMMDAKHPFVAMSGEGENEFRKQIADHSKDGLKGMSYGQSPALSPSRSRRRFQHCRATSCPSSSRSQFRSPPTRT